MFLKFSDGLTRYYEVHGHGETLILLHHGFGCTKMWKEIWPPLVEAKFRVVLYDRRGFGRSEKAPDFFDFYVSPGFREAGVRELKELKDRLGLPSFHLVGQCEGGVVAVDYAAAHPADVKSIVTSSTQCYSPVPMAEFNRQRFQGSFDELEPPLRQKLIEWHGMEHAPAFYEQFRKEGGSYGTASFDLRPLLPSVRCPALVLFPDRSSLFEVEQGVAFYRYLPMGELQVLPRCGHNTYEQEPEEYVRAVLRFQERLANGDTADLRTSCVAGENPKKSLPPRGISL